MNVSNLRRHSLHVGDRVKVDFGRRKLAGFIVEDRGPLADRGQHLFSVEIPMDPFEPIVVELPEDEIESVKVGSEVAPVISKSQIIEFLENGGLVAILMRNLSGGKGQPQV